MIDIEAVKAESIEHSRNLSDWNNEALLKEFCWSIVNYIKYNKFAIIRSTRHFRVAEELDKRIYEKVNQPHLTDHLYHCQKEMCKSPCASPVNRNAELRKIEAILEVKNPIPDILLP